MLNFSLSGECEVNQKIMIREHDKILQVYPDEFLREYGVIWTDNVVWSDELTEGSGELNDWARWVLDNEAKLYQTKAESDVLLKILMLGQRSPILLPKLYLSFVSDVIGHGVFAHQCIYNGDFINEYIGEFGLTRDSEKQDSPYLIEKDCLDENVNWWIDSQRTGNYSRFINHSNSPNSKLYFTFFKGRYRVFAMAIKDIEPDEQILFDYGDDYWSHTQEPIEL